MLPGPTQQNMSVVLLSPGVDLPRHMLRISISHLRVCVLGVKLAVPVRSNMKQPSDIGNVPFDTSTVCLLVHVLQRLPLMRHPVEWVACMEATQTELPASGPIKPRTAETDYGRFSIAAPYTATARGLKRKHESSLNGGGFIVCLESANA